MMQNHPPREDLFAYRDGELDHERRSLVEAHVLSCTACQTRLDETSDAEGMLRQGLQDPSDAYFGQLTESVMARVTGAAPATGPAASRSPVAPGSGAAAERPRDRARRRSSEESQRGRAPGLPWPAILSAASAAAAVVVVVVILVQRQDAWRHAPASGVVGLPDGAGAKSPATDEVAERDGAPMAAAPEEAAPSEDLLKDRGREVVGGTEAKPEELRSGDVASRAAAPPASVAKDDAAALRKEQIETQSAAEVLPFAAPEGAQQKRAELDASRVAAIRAKAEAAANVAPVPEGPAFGEVAARYGLPLLYDPARVSGSTLLRAEPDLRLLYQTGRAGSDSARVRLYLAEAARERGAGSFDAESFDTIVHHYRRAVVLARDVETARMARKRLEDFVSRNAPRE